MNKKTKERLNRIAYRYLLLTIISIAGLSIFYLIFKPLTVYPSYFLFKITYNAFLSSTNTFNFPLRFVSLKIIGSCVAGSAYLLLTILNLSTPNIKVIKRIKLLGLAYLSFLVLNIARIFAIGILFLEGVSWADFAHKFFWYFGSIAIVLLIWFWEVKKYNIKSIPFYSDLKFVSKLIKKNK